jgi:hypothetical protein
MSIASKIRQGKLPQGYELTERDVDQNLAEDFGKVLQVDVGKRCYVKDYGFAMENKDQRDARWGRKPHVVKPRRL